MESTAKIFSHFAPSNFSQPRIYHNLYNLVEYAFRSELDPKLFFAQLVNFTFSLYRNSKEILRYAVHRSLLCKCRNFSRLARTSKNSSLCLQQYHSCGREFLTLTRHSDGKRLCRLYVTRNWRNIEEGLLDKNCPPSGAASLAAYQAIHCRYHGLWHLH